MNKKIISCFLAVFFLLCSCSIPSYAEDNIKESFDISGKVSAVYLYNYESDDVMLSEEYYKAIPPASTVKIMTGIIACEEFGERLDEEITVTSDMISNVQGAVMNLRSGMVLTVKDILYGAICGGYNDAVRVIAHISSGTISSFVEKMNEKAAAFGMTDTVYANPTGWDSDAAKTSLSDIVILAKKAVKSPLYMEISSKVSYSIKVKNSNEEIVVHNRNALIGSYFAQGYQNKYAKGIISGLTDDGGYSLVTYAEYKDTSYLCIVMGAGEASNGGIGSYEIANSLLYYAFENYSYKKILDQNRYITDIDVKLALFDDEDKLECVIPQDVYAFVPNDINPEELEYVTYLHNEELYAPINEGDIVGGIDIYHNSKLIATSKLVAGQPVESVSILVFLEGMRDFFLSRTFFMFLIISVVSVTLYLYFQGLGSRNKKVKNITYKNFY